MGQCYGKHTAVSGEDHHNHTNPPDSTSVNGVVELSGTATTPSVKNTPSRKSSFTNLLPSPYLRSSATSPLPLGVSSSPAKFTPERRIFRSPSLAKRTAPAKPKERPIPEVVGVYGTEKELQLDKSFGYGKNFEAKYDLGKEVGRGHFGHTCLANVKKGDMKGEVVAVKIISKAKMTTAITIEDVKSEVKILKALSGHRNLIKFYDACEDSLNVYIVMELCEGGELLDRILSRGGRYTEEDAKLIVEQILGVVAFCHLQGVVHRDLKPENFLFTTKEENAPMKLIDFGLSKFIRPEERLKDIVGSAYYIAPEVLRKAYSMEADIWSIGVITYILLCGRRPFSAREKSEIFRAILKADPNFEDSPWPSVSAEAKDFVKRLLNKDYRKRMTAAQALTHPWLRNQQHPVPLDILVYKLVKSYIRSSPFKRATLKALSKALTEDELVYLKAQFQLLEPSPDGCVGLENFQRALQKHLSDTMTESKVSEILNSVLGSFSNRRMNFAEFCAAAISPYHLEALELEKWEDMANAAFQYFEEEGNRVITIEELAKEMNFPGAAARSALRVWIRPSDGKLNFNGYMNLLFGVTIRYNKSMNILLQYNKSINITQQKKK